MADGRLIGLKQARRFRWLNNLLMEGDPLEIVGVPGGDGQEDDADGRRQRQVDAETQRQRDARQEVDEQKPRERRRTGPCQFQNGHHQDVGRQPRRVGYDFGTSGTWNRNTTALGGGVNSSLSFHTEHNGGETKKETKEQAKMSLIIASWIRLRCYTSHVTFPSSPTVERWKLIVKRFISCLILKIRQWRMAATRQPLAINVTRLNIILWR